MIRQCVIALPLLLSSLSAVATDYPSKLLSEWGKINYYSESGKSEILNEDFFLSKNGQRDPISELDSYIDLLKAYQNTNLHGSVLCRYPARLILLSKHLKWFNKELVCSEYIEEVDPSNIESISLIYASGYLNNPASYYGHTMLRLNYKDFTKHSIVSGGAISYGAKNISNNPFVYISKGILGGYQGRYTENDNFINTHNYTNRELRDVWEYELNLSSDETQYLLAQLWELKRAEFKYFFFNDNCAHRIGRPIENITNLKITHTHGFWLMPIQLIQNVNDQGNNSIVKHERRELSSKSILENRLEKLSDDELVNIVKILRSDDVYREKIAKELSSEELSLALDQLDVLKAQLKNKEENIEAKIEIDSKRQDILKELYKRDSIKEFEIYEVYENQVSPFHMRGISKISAGFELVNGENNAVINYSPSFNDFTDPVMIGQEISKFKMGEMEFSIDAKSHIDIRSFQLLDIRSLSYSKLPADITRDSSWGVTVEYSAQNLSCEKCSTIKIKGLKGFTRRFEGSATMYSLFGGEVENKRYDQYRYFSAISEMGLVKQRFNGDIIHAEFEAKLNQMFKKLDINLNTTYSHKINNKFEMNVYTQLTDNNGSVGGVKWVWKFN